MRGRFRDGWGTKRPNSGGRRPRAPDPVPAQRVRLLAMKAEGHSQEAIAVELGVPRSRVRIWCRRVGVPKGPRRRGLANTPEVALAEGYRFAIVAPRGHAVSFHKDERTADVAMYPLRRSGCVIMPIEGLIR